MEEIRLLIDHLLCTKCIMEIISFTPADNLYLLPHHRGKCTKKSSDNPSTKWVTLKELQVVTRIRSQVCLASKMIHSLHVQLEMHSFYAGGNALASFYALLSRVPTCQRSSLKFIQPGRKLSDTSSLVWREGQSALMASTRGAKESLVIMALALDACSRNLRSFSVSWEMPGIMMAPDTTQRGDVDWETGKTPVNRSRPDIPR